MGCGGERILPQNSIKCSKSDLPLTTVSSGETEGRILRSNLNVWRRWLASPSYMYIRYHTNARNKGGRGKGEGKDGDKRIGESTLNSSSNK